ncbi:hypothetical protein [Dyella acidisoli]|uniref:Uncharacterized protein n=1 Tax=Dyella acidisoli TaxID=1867834 RepID=A0ABQ5XN96_9GAMM|nr:hypothetical protein [Dyella acidisoli]GLQ91995.1 hypothetical protein GCM10007901_09460 [Dyella acidisoli]
MKRRIWSAIACGALMLACGLAYAAPAPLTLFGIPLKGATRAHLREALKSHGMIAKREDDSYWVDLYDPSSVLDGASEFQVGYVAATHVFADCKYTFQGSMDTQLVGKVIALVQSKYGPPSTRTGDINLGEVTATWNFPSSMSITVRRGWPDTTTYLYYIDAAEDRVMQTEVDAEKRRQLQQKARAQNQAY